MKILYVSRRLNHSGFYILQRLIADRVPLAGILLPEPLTLAENPRTSGWFRKAYRARCWWQNATPCKTLNCEESLALEAGLPVYSISTMKGNNFDRILSEISPDIMFLGGGWPELIPRKVIRSIPHGVFNTHPSLLPLFRGTSITRWQILAGVSESGTTVHRVDENFDSGDIIEQRRCSVADDETPQGLFENLGKLGAEAVSDLFARTENLSPTKIEGIPQTTAAKKNYHSKWSWAEDGLCIDWSQTAPEIDQFIRSNHQESYQYSGPRCRINQREFIVRQAHLSPKASHRASTSEIREDGLHISRSDDPQTLVISQIQANDLFRPMRRALPPKAFFPIGEVEITPSSPHQDSTEK